MPKAILGKRNLKKFKPPQGLTLLLLQAYNFGRFNARLNLKRQGVLFRTSDIETIFTIGELNICTISTFAAIKGIRNSAAQRILDRAVNRDLLSKLQGRKGRTHAARYSLNFYGRLIYKGLQREMARSIKATMEVVICRVKRQLGRERTCEQ